MLLTMMASAAFCLRGGGISNLRLIAPLSFSFSIFLASQIKSSDKALSENGRESKSEKISLYESSQILNSDLFNNIFFLSDDSELIVDITSLFTLMSSVDFSIDYFL
jgi:hypothetical protein